jgi:hypothetical protein
MLACARGLQNAGRKDGGHSGARGQPQADPRANSPPQAAGGAGSQGSRAAGTGGLSQRHARCSGYASRQCHRGPQLAAGSRICALQRGSAGWTDRRIRARCTAPELPCVEPVWIGRARRSVP